MRKVIDYITNYGQANDCQLEELLEVKRTRLYILTREMKELGLLSIEGRGKDKKYLLK